MNTLSHANAVDLQLRTMSNKSSVRTTNIPDWVRGVLNPYWKRHGKQIMRSTEPLKEHMVSRMLAIACYTTVHAVSLTSNRVGR